MRPFKLSPYSSMIIDLAKEGATDGQILQRLIDQGVDVCHETVRKWLRANAPQYLKKRSPGRPIKKVTGILKILPDYPYQSLEEVRYPFALRMFLDPEASRREYLDLAAAELEIGAGKNPDPFSKEQIQEWASDLGKDRVGSISDLEFCLVAFWCAGLDRIPKGGPGLLDAWFRRLIVEAGRIREIMRGAVGLK